MREMLVEVAPLAGERVLPFEGTRPYLATGGLDEAASETSEVTFSARPSRADLTAKGGDVIFARMKATDKVLEITDANAKCILSTGFAVLRPDRTRLDSSFLAHFLRSPMFQATKDSLCTGATQKAITNANIEKLTLSVPPLAEQRRLAAILDRAHVVRRKRTAAGRMMDELQRTAFLELFGSAGSNPRGWPTRSLEETCEAIVDCPHTTPIYSEHETGYFCVRSQDLTDDGELLLNQARQVAPNTYLERIARLEPRTGDVLLTREGSIGRAALVPPTTKICLGQRMMLLRPDSGVVEPAFLWAHLNDIDFRQNNFQTQIATTAPRINVKDVRRFRIMVPSLSAQARFVRMHESLTQLGGRTKQASSATAELVHVLQSRTFGVVR